MSTLPRTAPDTAYLLGIGIKFKVHTMEYFKLDVMAFKSENIKTTGVQVLPIWGMKCDIGNHQFLFNGFLDCQSTNATGGKARVLTQSQLLLDIGHYCHNNNPVYAGQPILTGTLWYRWSD